MILQNIFSLLKDKPEKIVGGFAFGSFISSTFLWDFVWSFRQDWPAFLKWNLIAAGIATFNSNIVTGIFIFSFNYYLESIIIGREIKFRFT